MDQPTRAKWKAFVAPTLAVVIIVAGLFVVPNLAPKAEAPPVAEPAPAVTQPVEQPAPDPAPVEPAPTQTAAPQPTPTETAKALPTLAEALRDAYPGIAFFEGAWGEYTPASDDRVGQPGVYAGIVGITSGTKTVKFDGGTAVITPGRFDGFKNTTELLIEVR